MITDERKKELMDSVAGLLVNIVRQISEKLPVSVGFDDLKQAALVRLSRAAETFDDSKGVQFATYAKFHIRGGALDFLREVDSTTRHARRHSHQIDQAQRAIEQRFMRNATQAEIAEEMGLSMEELAVQQMAVASVSSIDSLRTAPDRPWEPEEQRGRAEVEWRNIKRLLEDAQLTCLTPRYRKALELYYLQDLTMIEVAQVIGVNESRISQILKLAREKLRAELQQRGIRSSSQILPRAA